MKQTRAEMAQIMLNYAEEVVTRCRHFLSKAECDLAAAKAGHEEWDKQNPMDGVGSFSGNPYDVGHAECELRLQKQETAKAEQLLAFAKETFLGMIPG